MDRGGRRIGHWANATQRPWRNAPYAWLALGLVLALALALALVLRLGPRLPALSWRELARHCTLAFLTGAFSVHRSG